MKINLQFALILFGFLFIPFITHARTAITGEISGQSNDETQPRGIYALYALTHQVNRRFAVDGGMRFGLNPSAPRIGVFAGMTVGVVDFFKSRR